jgi:hypothetical protein
MKTLGVTKSLEASFVSKREGDKEILGDWLDYVLHSEDL